MISTYRLFEVTSQQLKQRMRGNTVRPRAIDLFDKGRSSAVSTIRKIPGFRTLGTIDQMYRNKKKMGHKENIKNLASQIRTDRENVTKKYAKPKGIFGFFKKMKHKGALNRIDKNYNKLQRERDRLATLNRFK